MDQQSPSTARQYRARQCVETAWTWLMSEPVSALMAEYAEDCLEDAEVSLLDTAAWMPHENLPDWVVDASAEKRSLQADGFGYIHDVVRTVLKLEHKAALRF